MNSKRLVRIFGLLLAAVMVLAVSPVLQAKAATPVDVDVSFQIHNDSATFDDNTNQVRPVGVGEQVDFRATLDVQPVLDRMKEIRTDFSDKHPDIPSSTIDVLLNSALFTLTSDLTVEMNYPAAQLGNITNISLDGQNVYKSITQSDATISGGKITVPCQLAKDQWTFTELYTALENVEKNGGFQLNGTATVLSATNPTINVTGTVKNDMTITPPSGYNLPTYSYTFDGVQATGKEDPANKTAISATLQLANVNQELNVDTDVQVKKEGDTAYTTEHTATFAASAGDKLTFCAPLSVDAVITQMEAELAAKGLTTSAAPLINISDLRSNFQLAVTVPQGLTAAFDQATLESNNLYTFDGAPVLSTDAAGNQVVTYNCKLNTENLKTFEDLYNALRAMPDFSANTDCAVPHALVLNLPVTVADDAVSGNSYTVSGAVSGNVFMHISSPAITTASADLAFNFTGVQQTNPDGTDAANGTGISATVTIAPKTYTLTLNGNGTDGNGVFGNNATTIDYPAIPAGSTVDLSDTSTYVPPVNPGYSFSGWFEDAACTKPVTSVTMDSDKTVYAGWTKDSIFTTDHVAYIIGYTDSTGARTVRPKAQITRAEVATIFFRLLSDDVRATNWKTTNGYSDVTSANWFNNAVSTLSNMGVIKGYTDGTFRPNAPITRAEFATIAARFDTSTVTSTAPFTDVTGHWAAADIAKAYTLNWITGYLDNTFRPNVDITRAEAMTLVNRVLGRENIGTMSAGMTTWSDNPGVDWFYKAVQEATNSHDYTRDPSNVENWTAMTANPDWAKLEKSWSSAGDVSADAG